MLEGTPEINVGQINTQFDIIENYCMAN